MINAENPIQFCHEDFPVDDGLHADVCTFTSNRVRDCCVVHFFLSLYLLYIFNRPNCVFPGLKPI